MDLASFKNLVKTNFPVGTVMENPSRGTTTIKKISYETISYIRGKSTITVKYDDLFEAYKKFKDQTITGTDLSSYAPQVFSSKARPSGHDCNRTLLFLILSKLSLASDIEGKGTRGAPFYINIY